MLTHGHPDHIGGVRSVLERFGELPVWKRPWPEVDATLRRRARARSTTAPCVRTEGATLRALHTPGHAPDHLCFVLEEERALFSGDNVLGVGTTVIPLQTGDLARLHGDPRAHARRARPGASIPPTARASRTAPRRSASTSRTGAPARRRSSRALGAGAARGRRDRRRRSTPPTRRASTPRRRSRSRQHLRKLEREGARAPRRRRRRPRRALEARVSHPILARLASPDPRDAPRGLRRRRRTIPRRTLLAPALARALGDAEQGRRARGLRRARRDRAPRRRRRRRAARRAPRRTRPARASAPPSPSRALEPPGAAPAAGARRGARERGRRRALGGGAAPRRRWAASTARCSRCWSASCAPSERAAVRRMATFALRSLAPDRPEAARVLLEATARRRPARAARGPHRPRSLLEAPPREVAGAGSLERARAPTPTPPRAASPPSPSASSAPPSPAALPRGGARRRCARRGAAAGDDATCAARRSARCAKLGGGAPADGRSSVSGRSVLVTGGTGALGRAVVEAFLAAGDRVVVPWIVAARGRGARAAPGRAARAPAAPSSSRPTSPRRRAPRRAVAAAGEVGRARERRRRLRRRTPARRDRPRRLGPHVPHERAHRGGVQRAPCCPACARGAGA